MLVLGGSQAEGDPGLNRVKKNKPQLLFFLFIGYFGDQTCLDFDVNTESCPLCPRANLNQILLFFRHGGLLPTVQPAQLHSHTPSPVLSHSLPFSPVQSIFQSPLPPLFSASFSPARFPAAAMPSLTLTASIWLLCP